MIKTTIIETPLGEMAAAATKDGICLLEFRDRRTLDSEFKNLAWTFNETVMKQASETNS
jgi:AraC family transcriptional regulator of adaptative response/methylated-DNA-[protein]-cysteine methyltransferase